MKICLPTDKEEDVKGGIKTSIRSQRKAFRSAGIDFTEDPSEDYDILMMNTFYPRHLRLYREARKDGAQVVMHTNTTGENTKRTVRFSNWFSWLGNLYFHSIYRMADMLVAPTPYNRRYLEGRGIDVPFTVISNGVDTDRVEGVEEYEGMKAQYDVDGTAVVNLAMMFGRKGVNDFNATAEHLPEVEFRWFGDSMHDLVTPRRVKKAVRNPPSNVRFPGRLDDVREGLAMADIFFFPTYQETEGIALLEAAYAGLPIVVRDIPVYEDWLDHGTHCLKGSTVEEFAAHIRRLAEDPGLREELGANAREVAEERTLPRIGERYRDMFERLHHGI